MICPDNIETTFLIFSNSVPSLLYYSHIPATIISLLIGFFVYIRGDKNLLSRLLLAISIIFSLWSFINLIIWTNSDSDLIMLLWSLFGLLNMFLFVLCLYFVYVFIEKRDVSFYLKLFFGFLLLPVIIFVAQSLINFDVYNCEAIENKLYFNYVFILELIIFLLMSLYLVFKYFKSEVAFRKQIMLLGFGMGFFLISFFITGYLASYWDNFELEQYGLFGMTIFMGVLAYMIVKFKAFNIKVIGAQALVIALFILIASQFAFIQNPINRVLTSITLALVTIFGYNLIRNVKIEIAQKEQLANANEEINERKNQLQRISDHLATANAKLKELDNAKTEFVSIVAHQLQSPPTTIKGYSMLLTDGTYGELTPDQKDIMQKIFNANEQQVAFVDDLLSVSRLESGRVVFNFENCQIQDICQDVIDNLFVKAKDKSLYLEFNKPDQLIPEVKVDRAKIREAITNLVDNAVKYTKRGGVNLSLKICTLGDDKCTRGNHLRVTVSDTGIGVPAEEMPRLFSKFSRGKDVKRLNAGGTGLGLYVVKMIIEGNRGKVWVESDGEGKGSRFIIELPIG